MPPTPPAQTGSGGALGGLKKKIGFQPLWAWMAEILGVALAYALWKQRQSAASTSSTTSGSSSTDGTVPADQVPDVIIQNGALQGPSTTGSTTTGSTTTTTAATPPAAPAAPAKTTSVSVNEYSWTDTGQSWTVAQLASKLGVSVGALKPSNTKGQQAIKNSTKPMGKGAKFTYVKAPKTVTTTT